MQYYDWKTFGMKTFGRFMCRCENNNKMYCKKKQFQGSYGIHMCREKGSVVGSCEYCHERTGSIEAGNFMAD